MSDQPLRNIQLIRDALRDFQWTTLVVLRTLIDHIDVLASGLRGANPEWDERFRRSWWAVEEVYAVMKDRGISVPDAALSEVVERALTELRTIAESWAN